MHQKCQEKSSSLNIDLQSQLYSVPIELVQLINFLQDGYDLNDKGYSKEALAISQTIMCNFQIQNKNKEISSYKRHNKNTQPPFPLFAYFLTPLQTLTMPSHSVHLLSARGTEPPNKLSKRGGGA